MAIIVGRAELILICFGHGAPQEFAPFSLGYCYSYGCHKFFWEFLVIVQVKFHSAGVRGGRYSCGGPRYGNSSSRSRCGPTLSVTFRFAYIEKKISATSSVSVRPLCGKDTGLRGS